MEFYVVDPKTTDYDAWTERVREFLGAESMNYTESTGQIYYLGDDVAVPWDEASVLFSVDGDEGGIVEVRDADEHFYVFIDDLDPYHSGNHTDGNLDIHRCTFCDLNLLLHGLVAIYICL